MNVIDTELPGCLILEPKVFSDNRGRFVKTFHDSTFGGLGIASEFKEEYYSVSNKGVVRGVHFQLPPDDHYKLVYCTTGVVIDVVVDLRKGSPTFAKYESFELSASNGRMLYIPKGFAHGFCAMEDNSVLMYRVSTEYSPNNDSGISWDSIGFDWPVNNPVMSKRDESFIDLESFDSPFSFEGKQ